MPVIFKKCPSCGKRFGVQLVVKTPENSDVEIQRSQMATATSAGLGRSAGYEHAIVAGVEEGQTARVVDEEHYAETFRCNRCGHTWNEEATERDNYTLPVED